MELIIKIILMIISGIFLAYFCGIETAIFSSSVHKLKEKYTKKTAYFDYWESKSNYVIAAIMLGTNLISVGIGVLTASIILDYYTQIPHLNYYLPVIITLILILIEIISKVYSRLNSEAVANFGITGLVVFSRLITPITNVLVAFSESIIKVFLKNYTPENPFLTNTEIKMLLDKEDSIVDITTGEKKLLTNILSYASAKIGQIMSPKEKIFAINVDENITDITRIAVTNKYSRIPVYKGTVDNIVGIIYKKDLIVSCRNENLFVIEDIIRPVYFINENYSISNLLNEFRTGHQHIAIVINELQKTAGIVTIEDIVEEIFGEIYDEYDIKQ